MPPKPRLRDLPLLVPAGSLAAQSNPPYLDAALPVDARVRDLLQRMTLEEKVAQVQGFLVRDAHAFDEKGDFVGGSDAAGLANGAGRRSPASPGEPRAGVSRRSGTRRAAG